jgi:hypothetical protein
VRFDYDQPLYEGRHIDCDVEDLLLSSQPRLPRSLPTQARADIALLGFRLPADAEAIERIRSLTPLHPEDLTRYGGVCCVGILRRSSPLISAVLQPRPLVHSQRRCNAHLASQRHLQTRVAWQVRTARQWFRCCAAQLPVAWRQLRRTVARHCSVRGPKRVLSAYRLRHEYMRFCGT